MPIMLRKYKHAVAHVASQFPIRRTHYSKLIRWWAEMKGLREGRLTRRSALDFFAAIGPEGKLID
jgi:hypothetical protein